MPVQRNPKKKKKKKERGSKILGCNREMWGSRGFGRGEKNGSSIKKKKWVGRKGVALGKSGWNI